MNDHVTPPGGDLDPLAAVAPVTRRVLVVANPIAGGFRYKALERYAARLDTLGVRVTVWLTRYAGNLTEIAEELDPGVDTLVVGGGDGSINEAVTGLLRRPHPAPALGVLPFGTANVLAHELALPFRPEAMADATVARRLAPLHLGRIGDRPFILMVSAGFDGDVVHAVEPAVKRRWGKLAYASAAVRLALAAQGRDVIVEADGVTRVCRLAVVTTAGFYGGPLAITRNTHVTRAGLRLVTLSDDRPGTLAGAALALARGRLDRHPAVTDVEVSAVRLGGAGVKLQIDGDKLAATDALITAEPRVLAVVTRP
ncbi:diacylglycerol/lipid kinase family protein [Chthonobacter rhizosphaerae]|uniref:diacylglycerol/lipid kinase family protein n=1 Tax=Chthonobacter rhizosphaerae TaxID=2735553 RepID=UPI0015EF2FBD|nr:diacylglycerol kinase family protein [Chthonobacter rhizosphaerae]